MQLFGVIQAEEQVTVNGEKVENASEEEESEEMESDEEERPPPAEGPAAPRGPCETLSQVGMRDVFPWPKEDKDIGVVSKCVHSLFGLQVEDELESEDSGEEEGEDEEEEDEDEEEEEDEEDEEEGTESDLVRPNAAVCRFKIASFAVCVFETISTGSPQSTESSLKKRLKKKAAKVAGAWLRPSRKRKRRIKAKGDMKKTLSSPLTSKLQSVVISCTKWVKYISISSLTRNFFYFFTFRKIYNFFFFTSLL